MIKQANLVNDGLTTATCTNNNQTPWSYNQGVPLAALNELYRATGDSSLLTTARALAGASTSNSVLNPGGILFDNGGGGDVPSFKGVYVRDLAVLNRHWPTTHTPPIYAARATRRTRGIAPAPTL